MLLTNATLATMAGRDAYGLVVDGVIATDGGKIVWLGKASELPVELAGGETIDLGGRLVTPGLIDCHTHIVHGGNRALEFELRLNGASYEEVARAGGGIVSTVKSTRNASEAELLEQALARVDVLLSEGVTTLEIKSGYGLDIDTEIRMLRVAREVARARDVRVRTSFLGAHAMPPEYAGRADAYIDEICLPALTSAHEAGLADAVDGFCEGIAFSAGQIERVFEKARELGLPVKLHAEQLSNLGGTLLAARYGALSSDHLEHAGDAEAAAMAEAGMTAVILPGAYYTLRDTRPPPIDLFRKHRVAMAIATDCNPGSSPMTSLLLAMNMGCTLFGMTPQETLAGATVHAARALGLNDCGQLVRGMRADLAVWNVEHPRELSYRIGFNPLWKRVFGESS
ncbi:MAG: imidazolonepropionase [Rhizobiaceae bacterium]